METWPPGKDKSSTVVEEKIKFVRTDVNASVDEGGCGISHCSYFLKEIGSRSSVENEECWRPEMKENIRIIIMWRSDLAIEM